MIRTRIWKKFRGCLNLLLGIVFRKRGILSLHFKLLQEWRFPSTSFSILHSISYFRDLATFLLMDDKVCEESNFTPYFRKTGVSIVFFLLLIWYNLEREGDDLTWSLFHNFIMKMDTWTLDNWNKGCSHCVFWDQNLWHWTKRDKKMKMANGVKL